MKELLCWVTGGCFRNDRGFFGVILLVDHSGYAIAYERDRVYVFWGGVDLKTP